MGCCIFILVSWKYRRKRESMALLLNLCLSHFMFKAACCEWTCNRHRENLTSIFSFSRGFYNTWTMILTVAFSWMVWANKWRKLGFLKDVGNDVQVGMARANSKRIAGWVRIIEQYGEVFRKRRCYKILWYTICDDWDLKYLYAWILL